MDSGSEPLSLSSNEVSVFHYLIHLWLVLLGMYNYCLSDLLKFDWWSFIKLNYFQKLIGYSWVSLLMCFGGCFVFFVFGFLMF
jgi:hypothetical protein